MARQLGLFPYLTVGDAKAAIDYYTKAFGATEVMRHSAPHSDKLMHVHMVVMGTSFYFSDDFPEHMGGKSRTPQAIGGTPVTLHLQVEDARAVWDAAVANGGTVVMPLADQFWGDRYGKLIDPFGHEWSIGQTLQKLSDAEVEKAAEAAFQA
jgi:PhnB protein